MNKIHIIGIGDDGLDGMTAQGRKLMEEADLVLGAEATLNRLPKAGVTEQAGGLGIQFGRGGSASHQGGR